MPSQVRRTIGSVGGSNYVALPKPWMAFHQIEAGDSIELLFDGLLIVAPKGSEKLAKKILERVNRPGGRRDR